MMLEVVGSNGKRMPPYWLPQGLKIGQNEYLEVLKTVVKPWIDVNYKNVDYVWQQDSAPGHKAKKTQAWCKENFKNFWSTSMWLRNSPDLIPLTMESGALLRVGLMLCLTATWPALRHLLKRSRP